MSGRLRDCERECLRLSFFSAIESSQDEDNNNNDDDPRRLSSSVRVVVLWYRFADSSVH